MLDSALPVDVSRSQDEPLGPECASFGCLSEACSTSHWDTQTGAPVYALFFFNLTPITSHLEERQGGMSFDLSRSLALDSFEQIPSLPDFIVSPVLAPFPFYFPFIFLATTTSLPATRGNSTRLNIHHSNLSRTLC